MLKKLYRRPQSPKAVLNSAIGSLLEALEARALLSAAPQLLEADLEATAHHEPLAVQAAAVTPTVTISSLGFTAKEDGRRGYYKLDRTGDTSNPLTVNLAFGGSARMGKDYQPIADTITFDAGEATTYITLNPIDDTLIERTEHAVVQIVEGSGYTIGEQYYASVKIGDNDAPVVSVYTNNAVASEVGSDNAVFAFYRAEALDTAIPVRFAIRGSAANGVDYTWIERTITIPAGKKVAKITIKPVDDLHAETDETVQIRVGTGYFRVNPEMRNATIKIEDNDTAEVGLNFVTFRGPVSAQGDSYILRAPATGGAPTNLSQSFDRLGYRGKDFGVNTSPDGDWLLLVTSRFGGAASGSLAVIPTNNLKAGEQILISGNPVVPVNGHVAIANGGNLVIYASADGPHEVDLWAATKADGVWSSTLITGDSAYAYNVQPAISDDGTKLLFAAGNAAGEHGTEAILEVSVNGTDLQTLLTRASKADAANASAYLEYPDYAPDGTIVFGSNWNNADQIWRRSADGSSVAPVSSHVNEFAPAVLPSGRIVSLWKDRLSTDGDILEITLSYADGTMYGTLLPGADIPLQSFGVSS